MQRERELLAKNATSQKDYEAAEDAYRQARAEKQRAMQKAFLFRTGTVDTVTQGYGLVSPIDGEVLVRNTERRGGGARPVQRRHARSSSRSASSTRSGSSPTSTRSISRACRSARRALSARSPTRTSLRGQGRLGRRDARPHDAHGQGALHLPEHRAVSQAGHVRDRDDSRSLPARPSPCRRRRFCTSGDQTVVFIDRGGPPTASTTSSASRGGRRSPRRPLAAGPPRPRTRGQRRHEGAESLQSKM